MRSRGIYKHDKGKSWGNYTVSNFSAIRDKIIAPPPFFQKYPLNGEKSLNLKSFCEAADLIQAKAHLTKEGLDKLKLIKNSMNRGSKSIIERIVN